MYKRITRSAANHGFWETAIAITTSDDALTKGHVRYLEARLIEMTKRADRSILANTQYPNAESRHLPEADRANMEAFLANLKVILPVIGLDILKLKSISKKQTDNLQIINVEETGLSTASVIFEIRHKSKIHAEAQEGDGDFIVLKGSQALANTAYVNTAYTELKNELIQQKILIETSEPDKLVFASDFAFKSPSAAAAVVLDRSSNGRIEWKVKGEKLTYHQWQEQQADSQSANNETASKE